jgi:predicted MFS family arabinose efflux permease
MRSRRRSQEFVFIVGPLLVAVIATAVSATAALLTCAVFCTLGTATFATSPASRSWRPHLPSMRHASALVARGVQTVVGATIGMGAAFGVVEVLMPAFAERHGTRAAAGIILAAFSAGSLVGGALIAGRLARRVGATHYLIALGSLTAALLPLTAAWSIPAMTALAFVAGLPIAPCFAIAYRLIDELAAPGTITEAFAWVSTCVVIGIALGNALGGVFIPVLGVRASLALAAAFAGLGLLFAAARARSLASVSD